MSSGVPSIFKSPSDPPQPEDPSIPLNNPNNNNSMSSTSRTNTRDLPPLINAQGRRIAWGVLGAALALAIICLIGTSLQKLSDVEQGLEYTKRTKQLHDATQTGGLHAGPPGFRFVKFPSVQITEDLPVSICLSQDGLRIEYTVTFQYVLPPAWVYNATLKYRNYDRWSELVAVAGVSAIQHSCSEFVVTDFQNQRGAIQDRMMQKLQLALEGSARDGTSGVYAQAISVSLRNIELPSGYTNAISLKEQAVQDIELAINQRLQETTKAQTELLSAQQQALQILDTAENDANITLTRAYLKAQETLFSLETEADILAQVKENLNLTTEGLLAYVATQLYAGVANLKVAAREPAKLSRKDEL